MSNSHSERVEPQFMSERKLKRLFLTMDKEDLGYVEYEKLKVLEKRDSHGGDSHYGSSTSPIGKPDYKRLIKERRMRKYLMQDLAHYCEERQLERLSYVEFCEFIRRREKALWELFCQVDSSNAGAVGKQEVQEALNKAGIFVLLSFFGYITEIYVYTSDVMCRCGIV